MKISHVSFYLFLYLEHNGMRLTIYKAYKRITNLKHYKQVIFPNYPLPSKCHIYISNEWFKLAVDLLNSCQKRVIPE